MNSICFDDRKTATRDDRHNQYPGVRPKRKILGNTLLQHHQPCMDFVRLAAVLPLDTTPICTNNMATSFPRLLGLPPELSTRIYELHFASEIIALQEPTNYIDNSGTHHWKIYTKTTAPGLLLANKQFYTEATSVYYSHAALQIHPAKTWDTGGPDRCALEMLAFWLDAIPRERHLQLSKIVVDGTLLTRQEPFQKSERVPPAAVGEDTWRLLAEDVGG